MPDSKTGPKNLHLPPGALEVLTTLPRLDGKPHVLFGDKAGKIAGRAANERGADDRREQDDEPKHFVGIQKPWQRVRALAGLSDVRIHDLRHGFASVAVAGGDSLFIVGKLLGHRQASTTERYAHLAHDPAKQQQIRTGERLRSMLNADRDGTTNVVLHPAPKRR